MNIREKMKLHFSDDFFNEETKCDYVVSEKMKKIWAVEIDLLNELITVCNKHNIRLTVFAGTLLGAVRHQGMIPWDDDIDVCLTREEYNKLCKVAPSEFVYPYFFQNYRTDPQYFVGYSRLRNSLTTGYIVGNDNPNYNNGIYIDIFVMDGYIDDENKVKQQMRIRDYLTKIACVYQNNGESKGIFKRLVKAFLISAVNPIVHMCVSYDYIIRKYEENLQRYNGKTSRISILTHIERFYSKYWCYKHDFDRIIYLPFENIMVPVPQNYDRILRNIYNDYMALPPVEKRGTWHEGIIMFDPDVSYTKYLLNKK